MAPVILVTREHAEPLAGELQRLGAQVHHLPVWCLTATQLPPPVPEPPEPGVVVTSAAVARLAPAALEWMRGARVVAVGAATARSLAAASISAIVAEGSGASALGHVEPGACFVGARDPAPALREAVASGRVLHWPVYEGKATGATGEGLPALAAVTLASPSAARAWAALGVQSHCPVAVIGATTRQAAVEAGLVVGAVAHQPSMMELARAALRLS